MNYLNPDVVVYREHPSYKGFGVFKVDPEHSSKSFMREVEKCRDDGYMIVVSDDVDEIVKKFDEYMRYVGEEPPFRLALVLSRLTLNFAWISFISYLTLKYIVLR